MDEAIVDEPTCEGVEQQQQRDYPGLRIRRDGDAIVVHIPARFYNRIGKTVIVNASDSRRYARDESRAQTRRRTRSESKAKPVSIKQANPTLVRNTMAVIELAIERGVSVFNAGEPAGCAAIYEVTARSLLDGHRDALDDAARERLGKALADIRKAHRPVRQAWILRYALDDVYAGLRKMDK